MENVNQEEAVVKEYDSKLMKRLLSYAKPYLKYFIIVILLIAIMTVIDLVKPLLVRTAIDDYIGGYKKPFTILQSPSKNSVKLDDIYVERGKDDLGKPASMVFINSSYYIVDGKVDYTSKAQFKLNGNTISQGSVSYKAYKLEISDLKVLRSDDANGLIRVTIIFFIITVLMFFLNYGQVYLLNWTGQKIIYNIRKQLFKHIESLSLSFFDKNPVGRLVTRVTNDVDTLNDMYTAVIISLLRDIFMIGGLIVAMLLISPKLALVAICSLPLVALASFIFKKYDRDAYREVRVKIAKINSSLAENISGMKTVQIFGKETKKFNEFDKINKDYLNASTRQIFIFAIFRPAIDMLYAIALSFLLWLGGNMVLHSKIEVGTLFVFVSYLMQFFSPIYDITEKYDILQSAMASSERIFMLLDTNETIENTKNPVEVGTFNGEIEFKNVWFAYRNEDWVLRDVNFKIKPGENVAFVGATGAGKTSIISLISRFYDIQKGEILIDGVNIKDIDKDVLRKNIATVLQDVFLFTGDIKGNVRLNDESITDDMVIKACKYVNADKFIEKLNDKYDSYVNERGSTFSQGERQLIAFARAIAFNPPILVLDEATANIDTETESLIQDALSKITKNRTTIVVAHRLSTIRNADNIIVLHKGKIREMGKHDELLEKKGLYYNLYELQYRDKE